MTNRATRRQERALERLNSNRRELEGRLSDLWRSIDREVGRWAPKGSIWAVPLVAFAVGMALALKPWRSR